MNRYQYLDAYRENKQRPAVWMPQLAELKKTHSKLFNACSRFKTLPYTLPLFTSFSSNDEIDDDEIHSLSGLVSFREWRYFESQLHLFMELEIYLILYHNGSEEFFPDPSNVLLHGHKQLHDLIRIHGGKTMLAQKFDMKFGWNASDDVGISNQTSLISNKKVSRPRGYLSWGPFSVRFAIELLQFIRSQYLLLNPPLSCAHISMPSESDLLRCGYVDLAAQVTRYGGYENVARKLGLLFFDIKSQQMEERLFRGTKTLWKSRHAEVLSSNRGGASHVRRNGLAWDEELVVEEL
jgi:hypothetical protein